MRESRDLDLSSRSCSSSTNNKTLSLGDDVGAVKKLLIFGRNVAAVTEDGEVVETVIGTKEFTRSPMAGVEVVQDSLMGSRLLFKDSCASGVRVPNGTIDLGQFEIDLSHLDLFAESPGEPAARTFDAKFGLVWELSLFPPGVTVLNPRSKKGIFLPLEMADTPLFNLTAKNNGIVVNPFRAKNDAKKADEEPAVKWNVLVVYQQDLTLAVLIPILLLAAFLIVKGLKCIVRALIGCYSKKKDADDERKAAMDKFKRTDSCESNDSILFMAD